MADAFAHRKFIGCADAARPLFDKAGIADSLDEGVIALNAPKDVQGFMENLGKLRMWTREPEVK